MSSPELKFGDTINLANIGHVRLVGYQFEMDPGVWHGGGSVVRGVIEFVGVPKPKTAAEKLTEERDALKAELDELKAKLRAVIDD